MIAFPARYLAPLLGLFLIQISVSYSYGQDVDRSDLFNAEVPAALSSRQISIRFQKLGLKEGLSQGTIYDMLQDRHGFMWFTTESGLNRFDGYEVKVYRHIPFDSTTLAVGLGGGLFEDVDGGLWVGSVEAVGRMDPITERFTYYRHDPEIDTSFPAGRAADIVRDRTGIMWFSARTNFGGQGIARMDPSEPGVFLRYVNDPDDPNSLSNNNVNDIFEDSEGTLWASTDDGLNRFDIDPADPTNLGFQTFRVLEAQSGVDESALIQILELPEEPGILWIGSTAGLIRFEKDSGQITLFQPEPGKPNANVVLGITRDPTNRSALWVSVNGRGLARFNLNTGLFFLYSSDPEDPDGLTSNRTTRVYTDRSGVVWVASDGVDRFNPSSVGFEAVGSGPSVTNDLSSQSVWGIHLTSDNTVWAGTEDNNTGRPNLFEVDRSNGTTRVHVHDPNDPNSRNEGIVTALLEDRSGVLWVGSYGDLSRYHKESNRFIRFTIDPSDPHSLPSRFVNDLLEDRNGFVWIATGGGLSRWDRRDPRKFTNFVFDETDPTSVPRQPRSIFEDHAGFLWISSFEPRGLARFDPLSGKSTYFQHDPSNPNSLSSDRVSWAHERRQEPGIIWVCTSAGLNRLDASTGEARHWTVQDGLADDNIYGILEDAAGQLWMSTNRGISRFDPATETFRNYGLEAGLNGLEFDAFSFHKGFQGEMFFGGTNGLNSFFPNELSESTVPPEVRIVDLKISDESIRDRKDMELDRPLIEVDNVSLSYDQKDLTFDFVGFHFEHPEKNTFAYKLEGYREDWFDAGYNRSATYTNLEPGEYTFRVKAANSAGVWNEEGASIRVVINPPFWATWWFRGLALLGLTSLLYGGYSVRVRQVETRARELEGLVSERTAELKASNEQLEQSSTIVEAINQETSFRRLLTTILEEARVIPGVEKATALVYMKDEGLFRVRASSGWDVEAMQDIGLTQRQARDRYTEQAEELARDIFVATSVAGREGLVELAEFGNVASFLVLRVTIDGDVAGYLVFDNLSDPNAFGKRDVELLERLREHIQSAFIKTRILENLQAPLSDLQSTQDRLVQSEKMASLGQLTAGIAHEIRNPLNFVNNFSDLTIEMVDELASEINANRAEIPERVINELDDIIEGLKMNADKILEHGKRADGIVQSMLQHSSGGEGQRQDIALNALVEEYLNLAYHGVRARDPEFNATLKKDYSEEVGRVEGIPQDLGRVFLNLIGNAFDALKEHADELGETGPILTVSTVRSGAFVEIRIADNGPGIPEHVKAKIFEPFFTTKPTGSGTGLGLSMSYDIVTKGHGGEIEVASEPGAGAIFTVRLPL